MANGDNIAVQDIPVFITAFHQKNKIRAAVHIGIPIYGFPDDERSVSSFPLRLQHGGYLIDPGIHAFLLSLPVTISGHSHEKRAEAVSKCRALGIGQNDQVHAGNQIPCGTKNSRAILHRNQGHSAVGSDSWRFQNDGSGITRGFLPQGGPGFPVRGSERRNIQRFKGGPGAVNPGACQIRHPVQLPMDFRNGTQFGVLSFLSAFGGGLG